MESSPITRKALAALLVAIVAALAILVTPVVAGDTFTDIDGNVHGDAIEAIAAAGITQGCTSDRYCPGDLVSRGQMATFLARAVRLTDPGIDYFSDDDGDTHEANINAVAHAGIALGFGDGTFRASDAVRRDQMASFLDRAFVLEPSTTDHFSDDNGNPHEASIDAIATAGITLGCGTGIYCPGDSVPRDQMASFLARALDLGTAPPSSAAGVVRFVMDTNSDFDVYTDDPTPEQQAFMNDHYERMIVFSTYFDSRTAWYDRGLAYIDAYAIYIDGTVHEDHPEWVLKDADGDFLYIPWGCSGGTCPQYAGDFGNPEFRQSIIDRISDFTDHDYLGIWLDDVNLRWWIGDGNGDHVTPIDPRTGIEMTLTDWRRYFAEFTEEIRATFPALEISHNAIWFADDPVGDPYIARQIQAADTFTFERGANDEGLTGGTGTFGFETFLDYVDYVHSLGTDVIYLDEAHDSLDEVEYGMAAYLLTSNGTDFLGHEDATYSAPDSWWEGLDTDLGAALGDRYTWNGLLRRDFEQGFVLLNQPEASVVSADLGATYQLLDGTVVTSVDLAEKSAVVLLIP